MVSRLRPGFERKTPNICISVTPEVFMNYGVFCRNINSSASRELTFFIKKIIKDGEIQKKYLKKKFFIKRIKNKELQKISKINISIERTIAEKFKKIVHDIKEDKLKITTILTNRIMEQMGGKE